MNDPLDLSEPTVPLAPRDRKRYLERIDRYRRECGCASGAVFVIVALIVCLFVAVGGDWSEANRLVWTLLGIGFVVSSGVIGKLFGIGLARVRLGLLYWSMKRRGILAEFGSE